MERRPVRILVVDDYEPWRVFIRATLETRAGFHLYEAADGSQAIRQAREITPDLILLDISLPGVNGLEVARQIRQALPGQKICFVTEDRSPDIAEEALDTGALGFLVKSDAAHELVPAVNAVLGGKRFLSSSLVGRISIATPEHIAVTSRELTRRAAPQSTHCHEIAVYSDDATLVAGFAQFIEAALKSDEAVIAVVTQLHRADILDKLKPNGVNVRAAINNGSFILLTVAEILPSLMLDGAPNRDRCLTTLGDLIADAPHSAARANSRVLACGEIAPTLLAKGDTEGAVRLEQLWDEITKMYSAYTLCGYLRQAFSSRKRKLTFQRICAEHSAVYEY